MFLPDSCSLRSLDPTRFNDQMAGRRMIFLGDSLMRGNWQSLACWLADQVSMNPHPCVNTSAHNTSHLLMLIWRAWEKLMETGTAPIKKLMHVPTMLPAVPTRPQIHFQIAGTQYLHACNSVALVRAPRCYEKTARMQPWSGAGCRGLRYLGQY